jgi:microcin C transport system substrate-binding protein
MRDWRVTIKANARLSSTIVTAVLSLLFSALAGAEEWRHGLSYFGDLKYPPGFAHFDYVNPNAPKGGKLSDAQIGSFNNLHPYIDKGRAAACSDVGCMLAFDGLMKYAEDELASTYGLIAESVRLADDFTWVEFRLNPKARWHDGVPITVDDVIWTLNTIKSEAALGWKTSYKDVISAEQMGPRTVRFNFSKFAPRSAQLALHMAGFWPMAKHYWEGRDFHATTLEPPLGNGAYRITEVDPGHKVVYERVKDYWAADLNVQLGSHNVDRIEFPYFLDKNVIIEAQKAGVFDFRREHDAKSWATSYDFEARDLGLFKMEKRVIKRPWGINWSILFNTRIEKFSDVRVREALFLAYDFDWGNRVLQYGEYERVKSYFEGSDMSSAGTLPSAEELALLEPFRGQIPDRVFTHTYDFPQTAGVGRNRDQLIRASKLLDEAGWVIKDFKRVNQQTGEPLTIDFLLKSVDEEKILMTYADSLKRLGIESRIRVVERSQYRHRIRHYDFDATGHTYWQTKIPPSWATRSRWLSVNRDRVNTDNYAGVANPAIDFLVEELIAANTEQKMNTAARALDRILLWNFYLIPSGYPPAHRLVYWDRFDDPGFTLNRTGWFDLWWIDPEKDARVKAGVGALRGSSAQGGR